LERAPPPVIDWSPSPLTMKVASPPMEVASPPMEVGPGDDVAAGLDRAAVEVGSTLDGQRTVDVEAALDLGVATDVEHDIAEGDVAGIDGAAVALELDGAAGGVDFAVGDGEVAADLDVAVDGERAVGLVDDDVGELAATGERLIALAVDDEGGIAANGAVGG
jgi:hypothetical protein